MFLRAFSRVKALITEAFKRFFQERRGAVQMVVGGQELERRLSVRSDSVNPAASALPSRRVHSETECTRQACFVTRQGQFECGSRRA